MTKLEEKLIGLGYKLSYYNFNNSVFIKIYEDKWNLSIETNGYSSCFFISYIDLDSMAIYTQQDIDNLQQAFNQLQKDLKELKQVEN